MPADFTATINDVEVDEFFGVEGVAKSWQFSEEAADEAELAEVDRATIVTAQTMVWREVMFCEAGVYTVTVTADGVDTTVNWTVREPAEAALAWQGKAYP